MNGIPDHIALSATAGLVLSLIMNYVPGLNAWFDKMSANGQRLSMAALLALTAIGTAIWTCTSPDAGGLSACVGDTNWRAVIQSLIAALVVNQGADRISPKPRTEEVRSSSTPVSIDPGINRGRRAGQGVD